MLQQLDPFKMSNSLALSPPAPSDGRPVFCPGEILRSCKNKTQEMEIKSH